MPDDLQEDLSDLPPLPAETETAADAPAETTEDKPDDSRLIRADGFETVDED